jgi:hypothetical protein
MLSLRDSVCAHSAGAPFRINASLPMNYQFNLAKSARRHLIIAILLKFLIIDLPPA